MKITTSTRKIIKKQREILPAPRPNNAFKWHYKLKGIENILPSGNVPDVNLVKLGNNGTTSLGTLEANKDSQLILDTFGISFAESFAFNVAANRHKLGASNQG